VEGLAVPKNDGFLDRLEQAPNLAVEGRVLIQGSGLGAEIPAAFVCRENTVRKTSFAIYPSEFHQLALATVSGRT